MKKLVLICATFLMAMTVRAQKCAVLDFQLGTSVTAEEVDAISYNFRTNFYPDNYNVIEINRVNNLMDEYTVEVNALDVSTGLTCATEGATFAKNNYQTTMVTLADKFAEKLDNYDLTDSRADFSPGSQSSQMGGSKVGYVDLGLSVKWATCNLGAYKPEEYGDYYAWGEIGTKMTYDWSVYKWCDGSDDSQTKYCTNSSYGRVDGKEVLDAADDVAKVKLRNKWRMPTDSEWKELVRKCSWTWISQSGVSGCRVTSKINGNSIFLPAAGYRGVTGLSDAGSVGRYWSSSLDTHVPNNAKCLGFDSDSIRRGGLVRYLGQSVRPVFAEKLDNYDLTDSRADFSPGSQSSQMGGSKVGYVDLGLSVKWATCNLGAYKPEEYGDYYAWGEIGTKMTYDWSVYKWCDGSDDSQTKYCTNSSYGRVDGKEVLDAADDVAKAKLGNKWRMPTDLEWIELLTKCSWTWISQSGVSGYRVTSKINGNSIFLPAAGYRKGTRLLNASSYGYYWSSSLDTHVPNCAMIVDFYSDTDKVYVSGAYRFYGQSVRPVTE